MGQHNEAFQWGNTMGHYSGAIKWGNSKRAHEGAHKMIGGPVTGHNEWGPVTGHTKLKGPVTGQGKRTRALERAKQIKGP